MATNSKSLVSSSLETPAYANGRHGPYVASLSTGAVRGNGETHTQFARPNTPKISFTRYDSTNLLQSLASDFRTTTINHKSSYSLDVRKICALLGASAEEPMAGIVKITPTFVEEITRIKSILHEGSIKSRERSRTFGNAVRRIENHNAVRKRCRTDNSGSEHMLSASFGGGTSKIGPKVHPVTDDMELVSPKATNRIKTPMQTRRLHTSDNEIGMRNTGFLEGTETFERGDGNRNIMHGRSESTEENEQGFLSGMDGWEKPKVKKRRSVFKSDSSAPAPLGRLIDVKAKKGASRKVNDDSFPGVMNAPSSSSVPSLKASTNIPAQGVAADWEKISHVSKISSFSGSKSSRTNHRLSLHISQLGGQWPLKGTRMARKANFVSPSVSCDKALASDYVEDDGLSEGNMAVLRQTAAPYQKHQRGNAEQEIGISEVRDPCLGNKLQKKSGVTGEIDKDSFFSVPKVTAAAAQRSNKLTTPDIGDVLLKPEKIVRAFPRTKSNILPERAEHAPVTKQRSLRTVSERKLSVRQLARFAEQKGNSYSLPTCAVNNVSSFSPGQVEDDQDELLAAAKAALHPKLRSSFWSQTEPIFSALSAEDIEFLNQQINGLDENMKRQVNGAEVDDQKFKGNLDYISQPSSPVDGYKDGNCAVSKGCSVIKTVTDDGITWEDGCVEPMLDQLLQGIGEPKGASLFQRLLSAIITEDDLENVIGKQRSKECLPNLQAVSSISGSQSCLQSCRMEFGKPSCLITRNELVNSGSGHKYRDAVTAIKSDDKGAGLLAPLSECQYNYTSLNENVLHELHKIGIFPEVSEPMPDLEPNEDASDRDIDDEIHNLEEQLSKEVAKKRSLLVKLDHAVKASRESERREFSRLAMDRLVMAAYEKYMTFWGSVASRSKNVSRSSKHTALDFIKRTLAHYYYFSETGRSCFDAPIFTDVFLSASSRLHNEACEAQVAEEITAAASKPSRRMDLNGKSSAQPQREVPWSSNVRQRELLLNEAVGTITGGTFRTPGNAKGKRTGRERDTKKQGRDARARAARCSLSEARGKKTKTKPKHKASGPSASVNELSKDNCKDSPLPSHDELPVGDGDHGLPDLSALQLPEMDDIGDQGADFSSWLNNVDDSNMDFDFGGLDIPMDDLSDIKMMM